MPPTNPRSLTSVLRALGSLLPRRPGRTSGRRVIQPWRRDYDRTYPTVGLTPGALLALLHEADAGQPARQFEFFRQMCERWPRLAAVSATRRLALTGLDWQLSVDPHAGHATPDPIPHAVDTLRRLPHLRDTLNHLADALGFGVAVAELIWERSELVDVVPVPHGRLLTDANEPWRLRVLTAEEPSRGIALDALPNKWIVHRPRADVGHAFEGGLFRASAILFLAQNLSFKDWLAYSQIAGMPIRVAQFDPGLPDDDKRELVRMLSELGTEAAAAFSNNIDLKFVEPQRGPTPYQPLQEHCNTEITILWLGQHLTTDINNQGSRAAAEVHDRVREDLLVNDIADEADTLRRDLLTPIVRARFGPVAAVPIFRRSLVQAVDTKTLAETLAVAINEMGLPVPQRWAHEALGIPVPADNEPTLAARTSK